MTYPWRANPSASLLVSDPTEYARQYAIERGMMSADEADVLFAGRSGLSGLVEAVPDARRWQDAIDAAHDARRDVLLSGREAQAGMIYDARGASDASSRQLSGGSGASSALLWIGGAVILGLGAAWLARRGGR